MRLRGLLSVILICSFLIEETMWAASETSLTGSLAHARTEHTATLLPDGHVLIVGGYGEDQELGSVELYDPASQKFSEIDGILPGRVTHTATLLHNGKVLVVGGQSDGQTLSDVDIYDPVSKTWSTVESLHVARAYHTATLLSDGTVLVVGGSSQASPPVFSQGTPPGSALTSAELYDTQTGKWTIVGSLNTARFRHTATLLRNGKVLVTGGLDGKSFGSTTPDVELYDPGSKSWTKTAGLFTGLFNHSAILLNDGRVLVVGGQHDGTILDNSEIYNPRKRTWSATGNLHTAVNSFDATLLPDGNVIIFGGANNSGTVSTVEVYRTSTHAWNVLTSLAAIRCLETATYLSDGKILVAGGTYGPAPRFDTATAEIYHYDLTSLPPSVRIEKKEAAPVKSTPPPIDEQNESSGINRYD